MNRARQFRLLIGLLLALVWLPGEARAAQCGSTAGGFEAWKRQFAGEAQARGVSASVPSGMRLEFGGGISGNMRLSFQAARSMADR